MSKEYTISELFNSDVFISHILLEAVTDDTAFMKHWTETVTEDKVEVKILVNGYEVTCDSFQDAFMAMWNRGSNMVEQDREELAKSYLSKKAAALLEKMQEIEDEIDWCSDLISNKGEQ